jgi:hypothetical protein
MWSPLEALLARIGLLPATTEVVSRPDAPDDPDIAFRSLSPPQAAALGADTALVCPVTRKALRKSDGLYLCNYCNTAYSAEGWDFLRETDKGRCCHCRQSGSVRPFREGGDT